MNQNEPAKKVYDDFKLKKNFDLHGLCKTIQRCVRINEHIDRRLPL